MDKAPEQKRKLILEKVEEVQSKKAKLNGCIEELFVSVVEYALSTEKNMNFTSIAESNAVRKSVNDKFHETSIVQ